MRNSVISVAAVVLSLCGVWAMSLAEIGAYQGQGFTTTERSTDVFMRVQGTWKCVLTQLTSIAAK